MSRPTLLTACHRTIIAKSYHAGTPCSELARHHGVSMSYVINCAKRWEIDQKLRRLAVLEKQERERQFVQAPPMETPDPRPEFCAGFRITKIVKNLWSLRRQRDEMVTISLPYLAIQDEAR